MNSWQLRHDSAAEEGAERLELLALCLELQLDLLLVALGPETDGPARPSGEARPRWDGDTLDLTEVESDLTRVGRAPLDPSRPAATLSAIAETIDELLANPEVRRHPTVVARLLGARASFSERLGAWSGGEAVPAPVPVAVGRGVEPGHFLG